MRVVIGGAITVTATERWLSEIRAGRAFSGGAFSGPTAAVLDYVQLFNPVASLVTVVVRSCLANLGTTGTLAWGFYNTPLAALSANGGNLLSGGAANVAQVRTGTDAGVLGTTIGLLGGLASTPLYITPDWYIELGAGEGFICRTNAVNIGVTSTFSWIEV